MDGIPAMTCKPGCNDCCGPVPFSPSERAAVEVRAAVRGVEWVPHMKGYSLAMHANGGLNCPFWKDGCTIYDDRPLMCRLFGVVDTPRLQCPHGCGPEQKLSEKVGLKMIRRQV